MVLFFTSEFCQGEIVKDMLKVRRQKNPAACWALSIEWLKLMYGDELSENRNLTKAVHARYSTEKRDKDEDYYLTSSKLRLRSSIRMGKLKRSLLCGSASLLNATINSRNKFDSPSIFCPYDKYQMEKVNEAFRNSCDFLFHINSLKRADSIDWLYNDVNKLLYDLFFLKDQKADGMLVCIINTDGSRHCIAIYSPTFVKNGFRHSIGYMIGFDPNHGEFVFDHQTSAHWIKLIGAFSKEIEAISIIYAKDVDSF